MTSESKDVSVALIFSTGALPLELDNENVTKLVSPGLKRPVDDDTVTSMVERPGSMPLTNDPCIFNWPEPSSPSSSCPLQLPSIS